MTKNDFIKFLKYNGACQKGLDWAKDQKINQKSWPQFLADMPGDYAVWLVGAVGGGARAKYQRARNAALDKCHRVTWPAMTEYEAAIGSARVKCQRNDNVTWAEFCRSKDAAWEAYERATSSAFEKYRQTKDTCAKAILTWGQVCEAVDKTSGFW